MNKQQRKRAALLIASCALHSDLYSALGDNEFGQDDVWTAIRAEMDDLIDALLERSRLRDAWEAAGRPHDVTALFALAALRAGRAGE